MSDSEDDFMSDKFLVDAAAKEAKTTTTYSARRAKAQLAGMRRGQAHNAAQLPLREREAARRREGLNKSLFEGHDDEEEQEGPRGGLGSAKAPRGGAAPKRDSGQDKAMDFMRKMGWTPGESLGKRGRSESPDREGERNRRRAEPIRISMWAGRKGLTARSPSPPPLRRLAPDDITPAAHAHLEAEASSFRGRRGAEHATRDAERKAHKARELLVELDAKKGVKFHPLHAQPGNPEALPRPLLVRLYPELDTTRSRSPSPDASGAPAPPVPSATAIATSARNVSAAEKLREQMRRDMLADLGGADEEQVRFGVVKDTKVKSGAEETGSAAADGDEPDWADLASGTKRVLAMTPQDNLAFLVSQLRHEHLFCFWCGSQYASWAEMDAPGGCPGEDEDDH